MQKKKKRRWSALISLLILMAVITTQIVTPLMAEEVGNTSDQVLDRITAKEPQNESFNQLDAILAATNMSLIGLFFVLVKRDWNVIHWDKQMKAALRRRKVRWIVGKL